MASDLDRGDSPRARTHFISTVGLLLINDTSSPPCRTCQRSTSIAWNDAWNLLRPCSAFAEWVPTYVWVGVTALCSLEAGLALDKESALQHGSTPSLHHLLTALVWTTSSTSRASHRTRV